MEIPFTESIRHGLTQCQPLLLARRWPGNIRELRNMMERPALFKRRSRANAGQAIYAAVIT